MLQFISVSKTLQIPNQPQYPISPKCQQALKPIITKLLHQGLLCPSHSPYNTPILPIKKPNGSYCLVQDLRVINVAAIPIYLVVPNPYTLPSFPLPLPTSLFYTSRMLLYHPFTPKLSRPLCLYLDRSRQSSLPTADRDSPPTSLL